MRSPLTLTMGVIAGLVVGFTLRTPVQGTHATAEAMDAASRDGSYLAGLDVENARKPRLASGRWSSNSDRARFIAGYEEGYDQASDARFGGLPKADANEKAGYRQGLNDGAADSAGAQPFRPDKATLQYLRGADASLNGGENEVKYRQEYRYAYLNGYQEGYYSQQKAPLWSYYAQ